KCCLITAPAPGTGVNQRSHIIFYNLLSKLNQAYFYQRCANFLSFFLFRRGDKERTARILA
ncbi:MAG: hypothetical protein ACOCXT_05895, partial [Candidatus Dojkabacteria bacterium]